jgi:uncharacterized protein YgiM (DUF1202 family)
VRKGRCSNDPKNCTLAASKAELPYAGVDSICPECSAPLAALAGTNQSYEAAQPTTPPAYVPPAPTPSVARPQYTQADMRENAPSYQGTGGRATSYDYEPAPPRGGAMKLTQMAVIGAVLALVGFVGFKLLQPKPAEVPEIGSNANVTDVGGAQVMQISPPQMRRVNIATQARLVPDEAGAIIGNLPVGSLLDVTGQAQVNGINWLRITLPNDSSKSGFVREDQLASLGDGGLAISPMDPMTPGGQAVPGVPAPATEIIGPVQPLTPTKFYIASRTANLRQEANAASTRVAALPFNEEVSVIAQRSVGDKLWYQVQLPTGGVAWINARLLSGDPRETPIDTAPATDQKPEKVGPNSLPPTDLPSTEIGKRDNQEALSAYGNGTTLRVDATTANLRKEPGATGNSIVEAMGRDTLMTVEDVRIVNGVPWYRVTSPNGAQGWVSGRTVVENR